MKKISTLYTPFNVFIILMATVSVAAIKAKAAGSILFEPGIGYKQETLKLTDLSNNLTTYKFSGPVASLKIGMHSATGVSLSLVGEYASGKADITPAVSEKPKYKHSTYGVQLGVSALGAMKIYLGYAPYNTFQVEDTASGFQGFKLSGNTYQAGLMFFPFSRLGLGVQYNVNQYKEITGHQFNSGTDVNTYFSKVDSQDLTFNIAILF